MGTPEYFARGSVNFALMQTQVVVIVGAGMVGSQVGEELAKCGIGHLRFIDHDILERPNLSRHALDSDYLGWNKAEAMTVYLGEHVEGLRAEAVPRKVDNTVSNRLLDSWLHDADLIIAATDDRRAQRRTGQRALALGIPSLFPGLYVEGGGEVIVQFDNQLPCFSCWDEFRDDNTQLRGAAASNFLALPVIYTTVRLTIGIIDPQAEDERRLMQAGQGDPPYLVFGLNRFGTLESGFNTWRPTCPVCHGRNAALVTEGTAQSATIPVSEVPTASMMVPPRDREPSVGAKLGEKLAFVVGAVAFTVAPAGVMELAFHAAKSHTNPALSVVSIPCAIWLLAGMYLTFKAISNLFRGW